MSRCPQILAKNDEADGAKDESTERVSGDMILTRMARGVASNATLDRGTGIPEGFAGNHPIKGPLDGVFPFAKTVVALSFRQRGNISVHGRCLLIVVASPYVESFSRHVRSAQC